MLLQGGRPSKGPTYRFGFEQNVIKMNPQLFEQGSFIFKIILVSGIHGIVGIGSGSSSIAKECTGLKHARLCCWLGWLGGWSNARIVHGSLHDGLLLPLVIGRSSRNRSCSWSRIHRSTRIPIIITGITSLWLSSGTTTCWSSLPLIGLRLLLLLLMMIGTRSRNSSSRGRSRPRIPLIVCFLSITTRICGSSIVIETSPSTSCAGSSTSHSSRSGSSSRTRSSSTIAIEGIGRSRS
mmetsp:Transcript_27790/g.67614  ORF Transcript_27790/g.67614 Transcript_27790/m.67614 type:complete len:237 (+) Transcript_27790:3286-3996(+)